MKKVTYITLAACTLLALSGCYQPKRKVQSSSAPPVVYTPPGQAAQAPASPGPLGQGTNTKEALPPQQYLDVTDSETITVEKVTTETILPSMQYVNDRIFEYGRKLDYWKEIDNQSLVVNISQEDTEQMVRCFRDLQKVLGGYSSIRDSVLKTSSVQSGAGMSGVDLQELQKMDIAFLEGPCGRMLAGEADKAAGWNTREEGADLAQLEALIARYAQNQEYEEVVQVWLQIPETQLDRVSLPAKIYYANALMFLHQEEVAAEMYLEIVNQMSSSKEQSTDLISLRKKLADLYTASGNYPAAEEQYRKIAGDYQVVGKIDEWSKLQLSVLARSLKGSPELKEYSSLLRNFLGFIPEKDGYKVVWQAEKFLESYPYSAVSSNADIIKTESQARADEWLNSIMADVESYSTEKEYQQAIDLLAAIPNDIIDERQQVQKKAKADELVLAEAVERETKKLAQVQELQRKWNSGLLLVKGERFDEAIDLFTEMLETEYGLRAEQKIKEVALLAARADRRRAADIFIRYTKAADLESQKKLLIESRRILKDILVKYPEVEIVDKVNLNIERVEQEMNRIDPNLLSVADNGDAAGFVQPADAFDIQVGTGMQVEEQTPITETPLQ